jgi:two-component system NarL family response regulator
MTTEPAAPRTRLVIVEDNLLTRLGISTLLAAEPDLELVGEAADGARGVTLHRQLKPDVTIVDLRLPHLDGLQVTATLVQETPPARVLILTHHDAPEDVYRAVQAGALGFVNKEAPGPELLAAIRAVARGERFLPTGIANRLAQRMAAPQLTRREQQVLEQMFRGLTNRDIGLALTITERTVGMHVAVVLEKLGAKTRTEAVAIALERGLLRAP